jgi:predicted MarR family transcription regulator
MTPEQKREMIEALPPALQAWHNAEVATEDLDDVEHLWMTDFVRKWAKEAGIAGIRGDAWKPTLTLLEELRVAFMTAMHLNKEEYAPSLGTRHLQILRGLNELKAFDRDSKVKRKALLSFVVDDDGETTSEDAIKKSLSDLKTSKYIESTGSGRDGGYWITPAGLQRITKKGMKR